MVIRNDGEEGVSEIQLAADAVNVNRLIYLTAKVDSKKLNINKDYKITLDTPLGKGNWIKYNIPNKKSIIRNL